MYFLFYISKFITSHKKMYSELYILYYTNLGGAGTKLWKCRKKMASK